MLLRPANCLSIHWVRFLRLIQKGIEVIFGIPLLLKARPPSWCMLQGNNSCHETGISSTGRRRTWENRKESELPNINICELSCCSSPISFPDTPSDVTTFNQPIWTMQPIFNDCSLNSMKNKLQPIETECKWTGHYWSWMKVNRVPSVLNESTQGLIGLDQSSSILGINVNWDDCIGGQGKQYYFTPNG